MSILGSLLGGSGGGGGGAGAGSGAGGPVSQSGQAGPNIITINANSPSQNPAGDAIQNAGQILALLNQGSAMNGAVNYSQGSYFQSLNPLPAEDPYQPATLVGPAPASSGISSSTLILLAGAALILFFVLKK